MKTNHQIVIGNASAMEAVADQSIDLVVTSPPYPMIQMWDELFCAADPSIEKALSTCDTDLAFESMHRILDSVWCEVRRVIRPGGLVCINIGDATRTFDSQFRLFANHARIISAFSTLGFSQLPAILWRKPTNAPNKFMGSGMLPPGGYVTLEHEYILIFRWGAKREFPAEEQKQMRRESAYFWEERNNWFSDVWFDLRGVGQQINGQKNRDRSGAFPLELPYRLIHMFSVKGDTVLDPFLGTGTTMLAAMSSGRNCIGFECDPALKAVILQRVASISKIANQIVARRVEQHLMFVDEKTKTKGGLKHINRYYGFPVVTRQEEDLHLDTIHDIRFVGADRVCVTHEAFKLQREEPQDRPTSDRPRVTPAPVHRGRQLKLF
jgi:DNA modification methylase